MRLSRRRYTVLFVAVYIAVLVLQARDTPSRKTEHHHPANETPYCRWANPRDTLRSQCLLDNPEETVLVITVLESQVEGLDWLQELPFRKVVYVKSTSTDGFRPSLRWDSKLNTSQVRKEIQDFEQFRQSFVSKLHQSHSPMTTIIEGPNVGDEALSVVDYVFRVRSGLLKQARFHVFAHGHRSSWHSLDLVEQLRCLCVDEERERYKTLMDASHAYLFQCMPLHLNETELAEELGPRERQFPELRAFRQREIQASVNASLFYQSAFVEIFQKPAPIAVIRDCCATFLLTSAAIQQNALTTGQWNRLRRMLLFQPHPSFLTVELSMILERFWRTLFVASLTDFYRDFSQVRCAYKDKFDCPPTVNVSGVIDIPSPFNSYSCPSHKTNVFR